MTLLYSNVYHSHDQMVAEWNNFVTTHPDIVTVEKIGTTVLGKDILLYKIGDASYGRVMFSSCTHCQENESVETLTLFVDWLLNSADANAVRIRQHNCVLCIPLLNHDGFPGSIDGMTYNAVNVYRNCDHRWGNTDDGWTSHNQAFSCCSTPRVNNRCTGTIISSGNYTPGSSAELAAKAACLAQSGYWGPDCHPWTQYCGPSVESEPETRALKAAWLKYLPKYYLDMHCGGTNSGYGWWYSWICPSGIKDNCAKTSTDLANVAKMQAVSAAYMTETGKESRPTRYGNAGENYPSNGPPVSAVYKVTGGKTLGFVVEVCPHGHFCTKSGYAPGQVYDTVLNKSQSACETATTPGVWTAVTYDLLLNTIYPNWKPMGVALAQAGESAILTVFPNIVGGKTNPSPGKWAYEPNSTATITATPNAGYNLLYWQLDGVIVSPINPPMSWSVKMDKDHTLLAFFGKPGPGGGAKPV